MRAARRSSPPCSRQPRPVQSGRGLAVVSATQTGWAIARTGKRGSWATVTSRWVWAGSADNSWFPGVRARKSLIVERTTATGRPGFAMSHRVFATSLFFAFGCAVSVSSLSNLLKGKKKEGCERRGIGHAHAPRVAAVLPRVRPVAYFLGHESDTPESADSWQLMGGSSFEIKRLEAWAMASTCPRVALRVPPPRAPSEPRG